jgi:mannose-6-phosphate isomerase-like protein (cupin superfamily)
MIGNVVNVEKAFDRVTEYWSPKVIGRVNDQYVKAAKIKGEFLWHQHDDADELFFIVRGWLRMQLEGSEILIGPGEFFVVPKGTQHNPVADDEVWLLLIETVTTTHTGNVESPRAKSIAEQLG